MPQFPWFAARQFRFPPDQVLDLGEEPRIDAAQALDFR